MSGAGCESLGFSFGATELNVALPSTIKLFSRKVYQIVKETEFWIRHRLGIFQDVRAIERDAHRFWNETGPLIQYSSHWRGAFADDKVWLSLGEEHLRLYKEFERLLGATRPLGQVIEWGCGGGANAVHFAPLAQ